MRSAARLLTQLFLLASLGHADQPEEERYVYAVYFGDDQCSGSPASIRGWVANDDFTLTGRRSEAGLCADESICLVNPMSEYCTSLNETKTGTASFSVFDDGLIYECDDTNTDGDCSVLDGCYSSSTFPSCHFKPFVKDDFIENPTVITNNGGDELNKQTFQVFFSDSECKSFEGLHGLLPGPNEFPVMPDSVSCAEALACLYIEDGETCQGLGGPTGNMNFHSETRNEGKDAYTCTDPADESTCAPVNAECIQSEALPSCYFKWTSAYNFFTDPGAFVGTAAVTADENQGTDETSSNGTDEHNETEEHSEDKTEDDHSGHEHDSHDGHDHGEPAEVASTTSSSIVQNVSKSVVAALAILTVI